MSWRSSILLVALVACDTSGGGGSGTSLKTAESGTKRGSAGGFSAVVTNDLVKGGVIDQATATTAAKEGAALGTSSSAPSGSGSPTKSEPNASGAKPAAASGSAASGSAAAASGSAASAASGSAAVASAGSASKGSAAPAGSAAATGSATAIASAGSATGSAAKGSPAGKTEPANAAANPANTAANTTTAPGGGTAITAKTRTYQKPSAELASIKFELDVNWERDMGEAGTFSIVANTPNSTEQRVFSVKYGFEDQTAPVDCDLYRKFLEDKKMMAVTVNRQRGGACYVEGTVGSVPSYRYLLVFGGKRLVCSGSLYKDATNMGDIRDKVLMQAKKICESLSM